MKRIANIVYAIIYQHFTTSLILRIEVLVSQKDTIGNVQNSKIPVGNRGSMWEVWYILENGNRLK